MNAITKQESGALALSEPELLQVLQSSLYPGAAPESIKMVIGYCKAAGLDPMQKPVHIVPMWDSKASRMRDVVMPGVNLYRTQASRSGAFAGISEPEFGPMVTETIGGARVTFPEWARVTVKKLLPNGTVGEFTAVEYWIENYAQKGGKEKSIAPNAMWMRRPRGQIGKCAQAQALRLAFPEIASAPTAEEMEGKSMQADEPLDLPPQAPQELHDAAKAAAGKGVQAYQEFWQETGAANRKLLAAHHASLKAQAQKADAARTVDAEPAAEDAQPVDDDFVRAMDAAEGQE